MDDFCKNIAFLRKDLGLKQEELAEKLGIGRSVWSDYERGKSEPNLFRLSTISRFFNIPIDWLLGDHAHLIANLEELKKQGNAHLIAHPSAHLIGEKKGILNEGQAPYGQPKQANSIDIKDQLIASLSAHIKTQEILIDSLNTTLSVLKERLKQVENKG